MVKSLRSELRDLIELVLIPALSIVLPWPICFRIFRFLSRYACFYRQQTLQALAGARSLGLVEDPYDWARGYRLVQFSDHADLYLSWFRSDRWMGRYITTVGDPWPKASAPFLAITFHWGAGLWTFRHLRRQGIEAACLFGYFDEQTLPGQAVRIRYYHWRVREVERGGNTQAVFTGRTIGRLFDTFKKGKSVVALLDVPSHPLSGYLSVKLFDRQARFPRGLVRLAVSKKIPVIGFTLGIDRNTGQRIMTVKGPLPNHDEQILMDALAEMFAEALARDPVAWHFWGLVQSFLQCPQDIKEKSVTTTP